MANNIVLYKLDKKGMKPLYISGFGFRLHYPEEDLSPDDDLIGPNKNSRENREYIGATHDGSIETGERLFNSENDLKVFLDECKLKEDLEKNIELKVELINVINNPETTDIKRHEAYVQFQQLEDHGEKELVDVDTEILAKSLWSKKKY